MSADPLTIAPEQLDSVHAVVTVVGGRVVFDLAAPHPNR
jgi:hypothetical protein